MADHFDLPFLVIRRQLKEAPITLGSYAGTCRSGTGVLNGKPYSLRVIVSPVDDGLFVELQELRPQEQTGLRYGFELIYNTLVVKH